MNNHQKQIRDAHLQRLLLSVENQAGLKCHAVNAIKNNIFLLHTNDGKWVLKQFSTEQQLQAQIALTSALHAHQFYQTYQFHPVHLLTDLHTDGVVYGLFQYIDHSQAFTFETYENRASAIRLLDFFHEKSTNFQQDMIVGTFDIYEKWISRFNRFVALIPVIKKYVPEFYIKTVCFWSKKALDFMRKFRDNINEKICIIHGDVASHNFIHSTNNELHIIDFDLAKKAMPMMDYVQLAYRFFPEVGWSLYELNNHQRFNDYFQQPWFIATLLYPSDVLREWTQFARLPTDVKEANQSYITQLTYTDWDKRVACMYTIMQMLQSKKW